MKTRFDFSAAIRTLLFVAACLLPPAAIGTEGGFKAAVLHGTYSSQYGKNLHHDEFDAPLKQLGWTAKKFASTPESMAELAKELHNYDIALVCPLFNYGTDTPELPAQYAGQFGAFIRNGGALAITDAVYDTSTEWLTAIDPSLGVIHEECRGSSIDSTDEIPLSSFQFLPNQQRGLRSWSHWKLPERSGWQVIARCGTHGAPAVAVKRLGKGYLFLSTFRQANVATLENLRANLELQRMGLAVQKFEMPKLNVGMNSAKITLRNTGSATRDISAHLTVVPDGSQAAEFKNSVQIAPGSEAILTVPYEIGFRGEVNANLSLSAGTGRASYSIAP